MKYKNNFSLSIISDDFINESQKSQIISEIFDLCRAKLDKLGIEKREIYIAKENYDEKIN